jgi:hypothetical protein
MRMEWRIMHKRLCVTFSEARRIANRREVATNNVGRKAG